MSKSMRKGYVLTLDAILALMFVLGLLLFTVGVGMKSSLENGERMDFKRLHFISEDAIEVLNKKGVLDEVGAQWADSEGNRSSVAWSNASNITRDYLSQIIPSRMGYRLMVENDTIYEHNISYNDSRSSVMTRSARVLTGYASGRPVSGYASRAYLAGLKKERSTALLGWQRTVTSGNFSNRLNLTTKFNLPNDFSCNGVNLQVLPRIIPNEEFQVKVNSNQIRNGSIDTFLEYNNNISCSFLQRGENTMRFEVWDTKNNYEIGKGSGTRMVVDYNTSEMGFTVDKRYYMDEAESICAIKQQATMLMPGDINNISIHLETVGIDDVMLAIVYQGAIYDLLTKPTVGSGDPKTVDFSDEEISGSLPSSMTYGDFRNMAYSFVMYYDTERIDYEGQDKTPSCWGVGYRKVLGTSYIEVDYSPFPKGTDVYGYNMMSTPLNFSNAGTICLIGDYYTELRSNFSLPMNAKPWSEDIWISWLYSGHNLGNQRIEANDKEIFNEDPDLYMVRFGYTADIVSGAIVPGGNNFTAFGYYNDDGVNNINQLCYSKSLTAGTNNFLFRAFVDYGDAFKYSDGCRFNVTFDEDNSFIYVGNSTQECGNDTDDSATDALNRLVSQLDWDGDGNSDVKFGVDQIKTESTVQSRIRSMWGPVVFKIVIWI